MFDSEIHFFQMIILVGGVIYQWPLPYISYLRKWSLWKSSPCLAFKTVRQCHRTLEWFLFDNRNYYIDSNWVWVSTPLIGSLVIRYQIMSYLFMHDSISRNKVDNHERDKSLIYTRRAYRGQTPIARTFQLRNWCPLENFSMRGPQQDSKESIFRIDGARY